MLQQTLQQTIGHALFVTRVYGNKTQIKLNSFSNEILTIEQIEGDICCTLENSKGQEIDSGCFDPEAKTDLTDRVEKWVTEAIKTGETIESILSDLKNNNPRVPVTINEDNGIATDCLNNTYDYTGGDLGYALWNEATAYHSDGKEMWLAKENDTLEINEKIMIVRAGKWCFLADFE